MEWSKEIAMVIFQHLYAMTLVTMLQAVAVPTVVSGLKCHDWQGMVVKEGIQYIPNKDDPCLSCTCQGGFPVMCKSVLCSPPNCERYEPLPDKCCMFKCVSGPNDESNNLYNNTDFVLPGTPETADTTNLGLRLVASTVTSFLILALLLFMVHRLRQRRLLIMMRRMNAQSEDDDAVAYMSQYDQIDMGIEFPPYEEPPPPYTPPKPPDIIHGEPPPPYEHTPNQQNNNHGEMNGGWNTVPEPGNPTRPVQGMDPNGNIDPPQIQEVQERPNLRNDPPVVSENQQGNCHEENLGNVVEMRGNSRNSPQYENLVNPSHDDNYGLSVAVATVGDIESPSASPSHVIVRMHNNSPQSCLYRSEDAYSMTPPSDGSLNRKHNSSPLTQFLKRSDSMEIKRGSSSPRNSFHMDVMDDEENLNSFGPSLPTGAAELDRGHSSTSQYEIADQDNVKVRTGDSNSSSTLTNSVTSWIKGHKPFRVSRTVNSPSDHASDDNTTSAGCTFGVGVQNYCQPSGSNCETSVSKNHQGMPPAHLDLSTAVGSILRPTGNGTNKDSSTNIPGGIVHGSADSQDKSSASSTPSIEGAVGGYPFSYGHPDARHLYSPQYGPFCSASGANSPSTLSPPVQSPTRFPVRSGSMTSQFSVCSETGEKKRPKFSLPPVAIRNDMPYPLSPLSSIWVAPMGVPTAENLSRSPSDVVLESRSSVASPVDDPCSRLESPSSVGCDSQNHKFLPVGNECHKGQDLPSESLLDNDNILTNSTSSASNMVSSCSSSASNGNNPKPNSDISLNEKGSTAQRPVGRSRICYVEPEDSDDTSSKPQDDASCSFAKSKLRKVKPTRSNSSGSNDGKNHGDPNSNTPSNRSNSPDDNTKGNQGKADKPSVRKLKQKKRRSFGSNADKEENNGNLNEGSNKRGSSQSPHRRRRISQGWDSNATYKQYGFIDDPELLNGRESATSRSGSSGPSPKLKSRSSSRENSCHSRDRRDQSKERNRETSRERTCHTTTQDGVHDTNCCQESKDSNRKSPESQHCSGHSGTHATVISDTVNEMGDGSGRRPHPQNSASLERERRRKRRSTGDRYHPECNGIPNGSLPMQEKDILQALENGTHGQQDTNQYKPRDSPGHERQRRKKSHSHRHSLPAVSKSRQAIDR